MSEKSINHISDYMNSNGAKEYLDWIHNKRTTNMSHDAELFHNHLQECPDCFREFVSKLANKPETDSDIAELAYIFDLYGINK